jgi:tRNA modification GTPase
MIKNTDTIAAIASSLAPSGVGIIRVSGNTAIEIVSKIFKTKSKSAIDISKSHTVNYGFIFDGNAILDEVLVLTFVKPRSFTGETTVEIQCHGGTLILNKILELVVKSGARLAEPGEFTKRAFLNGRIDLTRAEAVSSFIMSQNDLALKANFNQLSGKLSEKLNLFYTIISESIAHIEAYLDDPEHIEIDGFNEKLKENISFLKTEIKKLLDTYDEGKIINEGINAVILGKPNAGKSSILNSILNEERAIVSNVEGTTRDTVEEKINLSGLTLNIIDTAGIRESSDEVEEIGIKRAFSKADAADLIIFVVDLTRPLSEDDKKIVELIKNKKYIVLLNKVDLTKEEDVHKDLLDYLSKNLNKNLFVYTSKFISKTTDAVKEKIKSLFINNEINYNDQILITSQRHKALLTSTLNSLENVSSSLQNGLSEDFLTIDLMAALDSLSEILGKNAKEDVINDIFSKFCMGK